MSISEKDRKRGIVTASAGNHAQGVSYTCYELKINCVIFMPTNTPSIKIKAVNQWGKEFVDIRLIGDTYDECYEAA
jgi:threonine dehydratase